MVGAAKLGSGPASVLYGFRKPKPGPRGTQRLLQAISGSPSLQVPLSRRGGGWDQPGMLVMPDLQPPVLSHPKYLFYSLALLFPEAGMVVISHTGAWGEGGGTSTGAASF